MRAAFRTLVALTLLAWGQLALATDYYWVFSSSHLYFVNNQAATPYELCKDTISGTTYQGFTVNGSTGTCSAKNNSTGFVQTVNIARQGNSCPSGTQYNASTGSCDAVANCSTTVGKQITSAQACTYNASLKTYVCDDQITYQGCVYTGAGKKTCVTDLATGKPTCTGEFFGSGESAGTSPDTCTTDSCTTPADPGTTDQQCVTTGGLTICNDPQKPGCTSVNGSESCASDGASCGYYNGAFLCVDASKPQRNCGYFNGSQVCTDPNNPTKMISETSPDHPKNGGNADGNENNDPTAPGSTSGSPQGAAQGATNEAVGELGDKLAETNRLLSQIKGLLDVPYDSSAEWTDGEAQTAGESAGQKIGDGLDKSIDKAIEDRDKQVKEAMDKVPTTVEAWFGANGENVPGLGSLSGLLPAAAGCSDYLISVPVPRYPFTITIPVCFLSRVKPLLEWLIWCLTAVGIWNICYSGLRLENAKASKGGY